jgi:hypothetical protein
MTSKLDMAYLVNLTRRSQRDLAHLYYEINAGGIETGDPEPRESSRPLPRDARDR